MLKGGKSRDLMRSGEGVEKQSGGGSSGLRSELPSASAVRSWNCGSHFGGAGEYGGGRSSMMVDTCQL